MIAVCLSVCQSCSAYRFRFNFTLCGVAPQVVVNQNGIRAYKGIRNWGREGEHVWRQQQQQQQQQVT